jgi:hypothetical protein
MGNGFPERETAFPDANAAGGNVFSSKTAINCF